MRIKELEKRGKKRGNFHCTWGKILFWKKGEGQKYHILDIYTLYTQCFGSVSFRYGSGSDLKSSIYHPFKKTFFLLKIYFSKKVAYSSPGIILTGPVVRNPSSSVLGERKSFKIQKINLYEYLLLHIINFIFCEDAFP